MLVSISALSDGMEAANSPTLSEVRKTALNALHRSLGAKMVNFGGWDMPVEYPATGGLVAEHKAVRGGEQASRARPNEARVSTRLACSVPGNIQVIRRQS